MGTNPQVMTHGESSTYDAPPPEDSELNPDAVFDVLADDRRRCVISCLRAHAEPIALADLATDVCTSRTERKTTDIPAEEVKDVYVQLHHVHVPKMVEANVVTYDRDRDLIRLADTFDQLEPFLSVPPGG